jgi:hypothetical protein
MLKVSAAKLQYSYKPKNPKLLDLSSFDYQQQQQQLMHPSLDKLDDTGKIFAEC